MAKVSMYFSAISLFFLYYFVSQILLFNNLPRKHDLVLLAVIDQERKRSVQKDLFYLLHHRFFAGFDFTDYWEFAGENGYKFPTLRKE